MQSLSRDQVRLHIDADRQTLYSMVSDVTRTPEWSPEVVACRWIDGATGPAVGARFRARNKLRWFAWPNSPVVVTADPGASSPSHVRNAAAASWSGDPASSRLRQAPPSSSPTR